jgi:ubiquinone/menaquinone biosynthesis C-methylase UbiE
VSIDFWGLKSGIVQTLRTLPVIRWIFQQETGNLKRLMESSQLDPYMVLDLGTGAGSSLSIFPEHLLIIGTDRSLYLLKKVRQKKRFIGVVGKACSLPFQDNAFPFISAVGITEYIRDKKRFLDEVQRVILPSGHVLITTPTRSLFSWLRNLLGSRIHTIRMDIWETMIESMDWVCIGKKKTFLQVQYLLRT